MAGEFKWDPRPSAHGFGQEKVCKLMREVEAEDKRCGYLTVWYRGEENTFKELYYRRLCEQEKKPIFVVRRGPKYSSVVMNALPSGVSLSMLATKEKVFFDLLHKKVSHYYSFGTTYESRGALVVWWGRHEWRITSIERKYEAIVVEHCKQVIDMIIRVWKLKRLVGLRA